MGPIKANGKTLELKSPEEAIQLMQMGANYTQKMQALAPHRKLILMLGNNDLLNEDRLSFLIDLNKGNPEAIKKLLADHKVDPLDINTDEASHYQSGNHNKVTDQEAAFRTTLEDLGSTPEGQETLREINGRWDQASKEVLWNNPEIMSLIHEQRSNGIYETISNEVNRRRVLGVLPAQVSFLQAYKAVGDELAAAGAFAPAGGQSAAASAAPAATPPVVVTRVAMPKTNGNAEAAAKASAASAPRGTPSQGAGVVRNPLEMSDADILAMATPK